MSSPAEWSYIRSAVSYLNRKAINQPEQPQQHNDFSPFLHLPFIWRRRPVMTHSRLFRASKLLKTAFSGEKDLCGLNPALPSFLNCVCACTCSVSAPGFRSFSLHHQLFRTKGQHSDSLFPSLFEAFLQHHIARVWREHLLKALQKV